MSLVPFILLGVAATWGTFMLAVGPEGSRRREVRCHPFVRFGRVVRAITGAFASLTAAARTAIEAMAILQSSFDALGAAAGKSVGKSSSPLVGSEAVSGDDMPA